MKLAKECGLSALPALESLAQQVLLETNRRTLKSVRSGAKLWHEFSTTGLGYPPEASLPPRSSNDAVLFVGIFANGATAQNYIGYVTFCCRVLQLDVTWRDGTVALAIRGCKKRGLRLMSGKLQRKYVLDDMTMAKIIELFQAGGEHGSGDVFTVLYDFMLRVQSEGTKMVVGQDSDGLSLPDGIDGSLWCTENPKIARCRLRRRKHRPKGSLLSRPCTCDVSEQLCVYHAVLRLTQGKRPGDVLWDTTSHVLLKKLRTALCALRISGGESATLKSFRAGKACAIAAAGCDLKVIPEHGEWRSRAILNYLNSEAIDDIGLLRSTIEGSDDEM